MGRALAVGLKLENGEGALLEVLLLLLQLLLELLLVQMVLLHLLLLQLLVGSHALLLLGLLWCAGLGLDIKHVPDSHGASRRWRLRHDGALCAWWRRRKPPCVKVSRWK